jgi:hypothetical protein
VKNITVSVPDDVFRAARILAAERRQVGQCLGG